MIKSRHTLTGHLVSRLYSGPKLGRAFGEVRFIGEVSDRGVPILLLANHFSWWDGFIQYRLNRAHFRRKLHVMMLEEQLSKNPILNKCGCFSVNKNNRSMIESLDYSLELLSSTRNMVLIFPQGEIQSMHRESIRLQSGIGYILKRMRRDYDILLNVNLTDYGSDKKPRLNGYLRLLNGNDFTSLRDLDEAVNGFYSECKNLQIATV